MRSSKTRLTFTMQKTQRHRSSTQPHRHIHQNRSRTSQPFQRTTKNHRPTRTSRSRAHQHTITTQTKPPRRTCKNTIQHTRRHHTYKRNINTPRAKNILVTVNNSLSINLVNLGTFVVRVRTFVSPNLPCFDIVNLPSTSLDRSQRQIGSTYRTDKFG